MLVQVARLVVVPLADCVAPPVTSKILKYCYGGNIPRRIVGSLINVSISMLFRSGRALYSIDGAPEPLVLKAGERYSARLSIVDSTADFVDRVNKLGLDSFNCESPYGSYHISISEIEVVPLEKLGMDLPRVFKVVFHTPTILNSKLMSPPPLASK
ncbi:MAG: hypothetical protein RMH84_05325, partial [Sulfolobales archaeon]|nr:hypothetical protein [Sulfolobales archaeon]